MTLYQQCRTSVDPLWVPGAGHNDVELHASYLSRLKTFIETEAGIKINPREVPSGSTSS